MRRRRRTGRKFAPTTKVVSGAEPTGRFDVRVGTRVEEAVRDRRRRGFVEAKPKKRRRARFPDGLRVGAVGERSLGFR